MCCQKLLELNNTGGAKKKTQENFPSLILKETSWQQLCTLEMDPLTTRRVLLAEAASLLLFSRGQINHPALLHLFLECRRGRPPPPGHPPMSGLDNSPPTCGRDAAPSRSSLPHRTVPLLQTDPYLLASVARGHSQ